MTKLTNKRIKYIIDQKRRNIRTTKELSELYNVSARWIQILVKKYKESSSYPKMTKSRRPSTELTNEQKEIIRRSLLESKYTGAVLLRLYIKKYHKITIPRNKLHNYLREIGVTKQDKKKQKQRKYCRYQRNHSFSLGHMDYHESKYNGKWVIVWIDDASRLILTGMEFDEANTENAKEVVLNAKKVAEQRYSAHLRELNTDKGTQFYNARFDDNGIRKLGDFEIFIKNLSIKHITSKRNHPQTNGKNERWFKTYEENRAKFISFEEFIDWYNNKIHLGLCRSEGVTPNEIVWQRLQPEAMIGVFWRRFD